tara:strand:- start:17118 stop:18047 length:930 start_codon:yes stop_codon:yes gene_type:complete
VKIYNLDTKSNFQEQNLCLTIGNFDGFHKGHQLIIKEIISNSFSSNLVNAVMSFSPHPRVFFGYTKDIFNILTKDEKLRILKKMGIQIYIDFTFDETLSNLSAEEFIEQIIIRKLNTKKIIVGSDFKFGKNRKGNLGTLKLLSKKLNFELVDISTLNMTNSNEKFSSSYVRELIKEGKFEKVSEMLGRNWSMKGKVIKGDQRARQINFPTANMKPQNTIMPKKGVYCVKAIIESQIFKGVSNFGFRPTVNGSILLLETHLFDFNEDIYGKELTVEFQAFIRTEQKFENFEELTKQIHKDIHTAKKYHQN